MTVSTSKPAAFLKFSAVDFELGLGQHVVDVFEAAWRSLLGDLQDGFEAEVAVAHDDVVHRYDALLLVARQRLDRIGVRHQGGGQHAAIDHSLRSGLRPHRLHRMRRIADQRHPAEAPARHRITIDVGQLQHRFGGRHRKQAAHVEPGKAPTFEWREAGVLVGRGVPGFQRR